MSSILNNPNALSALQSLQMTQQSLATVQSQVSTGLKVATILTGVLVAAYVVAIWAMTAKPV